MESNNNPGAAAGWVDTHLHLLPGLDDGPATVELALAMAKVAIADGTCQAVVTPHANYQFQYDRERSERILAALQAQIGSELQLMLGCELHLSFENVEAALANPRLYSLNGSRYLLVEFPEFFDRGSMRKVLENFCGIGLVPVLAHPERNQVFQQHPEVLDEYLALPCLAQVTAASFSGRFGKRAQQFSQELLQKDCIQIVASDGHSAEQRSPRFSKAFAAISAQRDEEVARALCSHNPMAMALDKELPYWPEPVTKKRSFWSRLRG